MRPFDVERIKQRDWRACLKAVHPLAIDDWTRLRKVREIHQDAAVVPRQFADRLVKRNPRGGSGAVGMEEQHRLSGAQIVVVDRHAGGDGLAGALFGKAVRRNEGHFSLLGETAELPDPHRYPNALLLS